MPDVIDLTDDSPEPERTPQPLDAPAQSLLCSTLATMPEERLRLVVAELALTHPAVQRALFAKLFGPQRSPDAAAKRKHAPALETCAVCAEEFEGAGPRRPDECVFHPGELEPDVAQHWGGWDEAAQGRIDTDENLEQHLEWFFWTCCQEPGTQTGCHRGEHVPESVGFKRAKN